jgi:hypothetical protein
LTFSPAGRICLDNTVTIQTPHVIINLVWGDKPERGRGVYVNLQSVFKFRLLDKMANLSVYPKDFISSIANLFNSSLQKSESASVNSKYIILSSRKGLMSLIEPDLASLITENPFPSFFIKTVLEDNQAFLIIQVNDIVVEKKHLEYFYALGKSLCSKVGACLIR